MKARTKETPVCAARALAVLPFLVVVISTVCLQACGGGSASISSPPPPPPAVTVTVTPTSGSVPLGNSQPFTAAVTNTLDTAVAWSVNGIPGGTATTGTITNGNGGVYTAL